MTASRKTIVAFFGITRSLSYTIDAINENVLEPARATGPASVCCHFFSQNTIENNRTAESGALDPNEYRLLEPDRIEFSEPDGFLAEVGFDEIKSFGDHWHDEFRTVRNLLHQLYSLRRVTRLALEEGAETVLFCRPDLDYHDSFLPVLERLGDLTEPVILLPRWQRHKGGFNDRLSVCLGKEAIETYGNRLDDALPFCRELGVELHSERLIRYAVTKHRIRAAPLNIRASRVRSDGRVVNEDFSERSWEMFRNAVRFQRMMTGQSVGTSGN